MCSTSSCPAAAWLKTPPFHTVILPESSTLRYLWHKCSARVAGWSHSTFNEDTWLYIWMGSGGGQNNGVIKSHWFNLMWVAACPWTRQQQRVQTKQQDWIGFILSDCPVILYLQLHFTKWPLCRFIDKNNFAYMFLYCRNNDGVRSEFREVIGKTHAVEIIIKKLHLTPTDQWLNITKKKLIE